MTAWDVHQHLWPEPLVRALERRTEPPRLRGRFLDLAGEGTSEVDLGAHRLGARLALLDRDGVDRALVSLPPTLETERHADLLDAYHEGILDVARASGGRIVPLAAGACLAGFAGACVSAAALVSGCDPLLDELETAGGLLFVHPGPPVSRPHWSPAWWTAAVDYTAQMQAAFLCWLARDAERRPGIPVIFALLAGGAPFQLERLRTRGLETRVTLHENVYLECSSYGRRALELCLATYGVTQLLYGSDAPVLDPKETLGPLLSYGHTLREIVIRENPSRILG